MTTEPALALDADDRETLVRASQQVTRHLNGLEEYRTRVQMPEDQVEAQRSETMTRSSLNLTIVATVFLPLTFITGLLGMNVAGEMVRHKAWLLAHLGPENYGKIILLGCFLLLTLAIWRRPRHEGCSCAGRG